MYNEIKKHYDNQYRLSSNALFTQFAYNLERGGDEAIQFISANKNLVESVVGSPERVCEIIASINRDIEAIENKRYFFEQFQKGLKKINEILKNKFNGTIGFVQYKGIEIEDLDATTLMPTIYRKYNNIQGEAEATVENKVSNELPNLTDEQPMGEAEATKKGRKKKIDNENNL